MFGLYKLLDTFRRQTLDADIFHNALIYTFYKQCPKHRIKIKASEDYLFHMNFDVSVAETGMVAKSAEAGTMAAMDMVEELFKLKVSQISLPFSVEITSTYTSNGKFHVKGRCQFYTKFQHLDSVSLS